MKDFQKIDWKQYNRPPFYQQWLCRDDTLKLATFGDRGLAEVDDQILALKDQWDLEHVKGHALDRIGKLLREQRNGATDNHYRILLKLRRLLNTSDGSIPSIITAIKFFYSSEIVHIVPDYPAGIIIEHDGEGTPGINFNRILAEAVSAGVSYSTKELFEFTETVALADTFLLKLIRNDSEYFGNPIKFNGAIKFDGKTANKKITVKGKFNGRFKFNGDLSFRGIAKVPAPYQPKPPFKFSSRVLDDLSVTVQRDTLIDNFKLDEGVSAGIRKHHKFNGAYKFNGAIKFDSTVLIPLE
jgi:hypothetical protein